MQAVPGLIRHLPQHRPWMITLISIATVVVLTTCGLGSFLLMRDDNKVVGGPPTPSPTMPKRDISTRQSDPKALTAVDVFPTATIVADPTIPPYKRIGKAQVAKDCRIGATADLGKLLVTLGCNQVVRATFSSPDGMFYVTAGMFNLRDNASAMKVEGNIRNLIDTAKGRLTGYISADSTRVLGRAATQTGWDIQGHFLIYCVMVRVDGKVVPQGDPHVPVIVYDIVEKYLRDHVIATWSIDRAALSASPAGSAGATNQATPSPTN